MLVIEEKNILKIYVQSKLIFIFNKNKTNIELFNSELDIKSSRGSFFIREKKKYLKKLKKFEIIEKSKEKIVLNFENQIELVFEKIKDDFSQIIDNSKLKINDNEELTIPAVIKITIIKLNKDFNGIKIKLNAFKNEAIFGLGEQYSYLNLKNKKVPIFCQEQGIGRGKNLFTFLVNLLYKAGGNQFTTYFPQPSFISTKSYFFIANCFDYSIFDFKKEKTFIKFYSIPETIIIGAAKNFVSTVAIKIKLLGKQFKLPEWIFNGAILGIQGGKEIVLEKLKKAKEYNIKVSAVWCQDWEGKRITSFGKQLFWDWIYDEKLYPELPKFIEELKKENIKFLGYINPFLCTDGKLYQIAKEKNLLIKDKDGNPYLTKITTFPAAILDLSNKETIKWIKEIIKNNLIDIGLSGWMADFGEHTPIDSIIKDSNFPKLFKYINKNKFFESNDLNDNTIEDPDNYSNNNDLLNDKYEIIRKFHNIYPVIWSKINYEAIKEKNKENDIFIFSRSGFLFSSNNSMSFWAGDQLVDWSKDDGLPSVIISFLSSSFSGIAVNHSDIGGYTTVAWKKREKELFLRWTEVGAFSIIMRTHEGNRPDKNVQFDYDDETLKHFSKFSRIYESLKEYYKYVYEEYFEKNLPFYRSPILYYPEDKNLYKNYYCYFIGSDLLFYPVIKKSIKKIKVYIPEDSFIHLFDGKEYNKGYHLIETPIGKPAVFYRKNSNFKNIFEKIKNIY